MAANPPMPTPHTAASAPPAMLAVIIIYDQLLFRPIVAWADKFRFEQTASAEAPTSWLLDLFRKTRFLRALAANVSGAVESMTYFRLRCPIFQS